MLQNCYIRWDQWGCFKSSVLGSWNRAFLLHRILAVPVTAPSETPGFPPENQRILLDSTVPNRARLWHANMQSPFKGEKGITTFYTAVAMPFLVTASGKRAGVVTVLVLLWKPSCDEQLGGREDGQVTHLDLHAVTPFPWQISCCVLPSS